MRPLGYAHPVDGPASVAPPPMRGTDQRAVTRMERLRGSRSAGGVVLALASLALAGLIVLALSGVGFAGIGRSLDSVHAWWLVVALALNGVSML